MSDRLKLPPERDFKFYQRRKHDKWREVPPPEPALEAPVADSHAHIHMLPDPAWELARCAANGVDWLCMIVDPSEDGSRPFDDLDRWIATSRANASAFERFSPEIPFGEKKTAQFASETAQNGASERLLASNAAENRTQSSQRTEFLAENAGREANRPPKSWSQTNNQLQSQLQPQSLDAPVVRIAAGVHPHNAKLYDQAMEGELVARLADPRVAALGEIGLDYHYDLSPREVQRDVFRRQIELAQERDLPIALHLRGGEDPERDSAHREAFAILAQAGALGPRTLLHCCALPPDELRPWIDAGCYIAYGGAITFKNADAAREGVRLVPEDRLLLETDSPYMTPEPMRGAACTPAHVIFTAAALAALRGKAPGRERERFLTQIHRNTQEFYN